jgi:Icc-related predicted phosphoesterase
LIIDAISDLHGHYPKLEGGDILLLGGDYTKRDELKEWRDFFDWLNDQSYTHKVLIAGNHDNFLEQCAPSSLGRELCEDYTKDLHYIIDEAIEIEGIKIYGTPWTPSFEGMNPDCKAFTCDSENELMKKFKSIPKNIDILVSHGPPLNLLDRVGSLNVGSLSLAVNVIISNPKYFLCGHIHENGGKKEICDNMQCFNISYVNEKYEPTNQARRIVYEVD